MANFALSSSSTTTTPTPSPPPPPLIDQPRKRKLSDSSCCDYAYAYASAYASYACASSSYPYSYPSPPATSATLKTPIDLPAFQEDDHDHEDVIDSSMSDPDLDGHHRRDRFRPPPSPPPTLLAPVQELPPDREREREQRDEDVGPFSGLPTPVSPVRLWTDIVPAPGAGELFESPVEEDVDRQQQRNHVRFAFGPRVVDGDELAREDAFRPGSSGSGGTGDRASSSSSISQAGPSQPYAYRDYDRDYDRDFPPLSSLSALPPYGGGQARGLFDVVWRGGGPSTSTARATHAHARASVENHPQLALDTQSLSPRPPSARPDPLPLARSQSSLPSSSSSSTQPIPMPMPIPVPVRIPVHRQPLPRDSVELRAEPMTPLSLSHPIPMQMMDSPVSRPIELEDEVEDDPSRPPGLEPMDVEFTDPFRSSPPPRVIDDDDAYHDPYRDLDHDPDPDFDGDLPPSSPSRRSLADLPELSDLPELADTPLPPSPSTYDGGPSSPRLISLPGAETDDALLAPESSSPPRPPSLSLSLSPFASSSTSPSSSSSSLGIFVPLSTAVGPQQPSTSARAPDVDFPPEALALVDPVEIEGLLSLRKRAWFAERNAKRAELEAADAVKLLAAGVRLSPPVPGALAEWDVGDRAAVGREGEAQGEVDVDVEAEGQRRKAAGGDGNDGVRRRIQVLEMKRAEARRERKAWKEKGREVGCLLRKVLGPTIKEIEAGATATTITDDGAKVGKGERTCVGSGLVARMVLKRRDVARPLAGRRTSFERVESPLVEEGKPDEDEDDDEMDTADD